MKIGFDARTGEARHRITAPSLFILAFAGWVLGAAACSSFSSSSGGAKDAAAGAGGGTSTGGNGGTVGAGGSGTGTGGSSPSDSGPMDDGPSDTALPCIPDGGDASANCCPDGTSSTQDSDGDGVIDCLDACPTDATKTTSAGLCGCFIAETDTDNDHVPDCIDLCPKDPNRSQPGPCGCGVPDNAPLCLAHRYSFNDAPPVDGGAGDAGATDGGAGAIILDSVGGANGTAVNFSPTGGGSVTLAGAQTDQYIKLPDGIISSLGTSGTFEAWVSWTGNGGAWQRIFDFGSNNGGAAGLQGMAGVSWLFLSPQGGPGLILVSMVTGVGGLTEASGAGILAPNVMQHLAVVIDNNASADAGGPAMSLYLNGVLQTQSALTSPLAALDDTNNWLGRSQFMADPEFAGTYYEFRIYSAPRSAAQVMASFQAGPDTLPAQ